MGIERWKDSCRTSVEERRIVMPRNEVVEYVSDADPEKKICPGNLRELFDAGWYHLEVAIRIPGDESVEDVQSDFVEIVVSSEEELAEKFVEICNEHLPIQKMKK